MRRSGTSHLPLVRRLRFSSVQCPDTESEAAGLVNGKLCCTSRLVGLSQRDESAQQNDHDDRTEAPPPWLFFFIHFLVGRHVSLHVRRKTRDLWRSRRPLPGQSLTGSLSRLPEEFRTRVVKRRVEEWRRGVVMLLNSGKHQSNIYPLKCILKQPVVALRRFSQEKLKFFSLRAATRHYFHCPVTA